MGVKVWCCGVGGNIRQVPTCRYRRYFFGLQFGIADDDDSDDDDHDDIAPSDDQPTQSNDDATGNSADVVSLDTFRKRPTK